MLTINQHLEKPLKSKWLYDIELLGVAIRVSVLYPCCVEIKVFECIVQT